MNPNVLLNCATEFQLKTGIQTLLISVLFVGYGVTAQQEGRRVYQKDSTGNTLYHKQSWVIVKGQMCPVDTVGSRQYHKPCLEIGSNEMDKLVKEKK